MAERDSRELEVGGVNKGPEVSINSEETRVLSSVSEEHSRAVTSVVSSVQD